MDQAAYGDGLRRAIAFFALEGLLDVYSRNLTREEARKHIEFMDRYGPAELVWFDLRWPEEPP